MSATPENVGLAELVRDLLLAMVSSQNEANKTFIASVEELAATNVTLGYTKTVGGKSENREIKGSALAFGVTPTLLNIQNAVIEIRAALSVTKNTPNSSAADKNVKTKAGYRFKTDTVDAKYQNAYSYKADSSSVIRITVVPVPPSQALMDAIKSVAQMVPLTDKPKP
jgi:hypothetical protein